MSTLWNVALCYAIYTFYNVKVELKVFICRMGYNRIILPGSPSSQRGWKTLYQKGLNISVGNLEQNVVENVTATTLMDITEDSTSTAMTPIIVGCVLLAVIIVLLLGMAFGVRQKSSSAARNAQNSNVEAGGARDQTTTPKRPPGSKLTFRK